MSSVSDSDAPPPLSTTQWLVVILASIGFAFDIYELLMLPLIVDDAIESLVPGASLGTEEYRFWRTTLFLLPAFAGGFFGLLGGYLTDWFGRRTVLTWSILLYAFSAFFAGFSTSIEMLVALRCLTFIGFCVEFVAAIAWVSELFSHPRQRERMLGYTQAFSSLGGLLVAQAYGLANLLQNTLPVIPLPEGFDGTAPWRYTLMSGVIPALPLIVIRPFLPESPVWLQRKAAGTLKRPSFLELFRGGLARTTVVSCLMVGCTYGVALGSLQFIPQLTPKLPELNLVNADLSQELKEFRGQAKQLAADHKAAAQVARELNGVPSEVAGQIRKLNERASGVATKITVRPLKPFADGLVQLNQDLLDQIEQLPASSTGGGIVQLAEQNQRTLLQAQKLRGFLTDEQWAALGKQFKGQINAKKNVQTSQEIGGLVGRFLLAILVIYIVSRRMLLRLFQVPAMVVLPVVFISFATSSYLGLLVGMFFVGLLAIAQLSFWGNYLPRMYPTHLRGTGNSFAANIGGRAIGTSFVFVTSLLTGIFLGQYPDELRTPSLAAQCQQYAAAMVGAGCYFLAFLLSFLLPEPQGQELPQ